MSVIILEEYWPHFIKNIDDYFKWHLKQGCSAEEWERSHACIGCMRLYDAKNGASLESDK